MQFGELVPTQIQSVCLHRQLRQDRSLRLQLEIMILTKAVNDQLPESNTHVAAHKLQPLIMIANNIIRYQRTTVKPLMFACPLFCKFCKLNKTVKLKGANIDTIYQLQLVWYVVLELGSLNTPK